MLDGVSHSGYSEDEIVESISKWQKNNGLPGDHQVIRRRIWNYFCAQEPKRCSDRRNPANQVSVETVQVVQRDLTPALIGPWIWKFLNLAAVRWVPGANEWFLATVDMVVVLLECPICREEWRTVVRAMPPVGFQTARDVCIWLNNAHNAVNSRIGKAIYPYSSMVAEYGAPTL